MPLESMPLASGYLKATALGHSRIRESVDIEIHNFKGGVTNAHMANAMFASAVPDILAFSVMGWNFRSFGALSATFRQLKPDGWVIFGGNHVSGQAERVFRLLPEVDIVVNGEGEFTFRDILLAYLQGFSKNELFDIPGLSFKGPAGDCVTTAARDRIEDLDVIPSPFLTGALELTDEAGRFRYDVALMETNRGCPYKCSFCYWGGAVGQRVRSFSSERLRQELEVFGKLKVHTIVSCDANFGMLKGDLEFVEALIEVRDKFGFPRALETSWAKNKSQTFYRIVERMQAVGMKSSFTLALQTLNDEALTEMNRRNMKVNEWEDLVAWLGQKGLDCYAELIWGAPGETAESFIKGYDRLAQRVSRIAVYPMLLLPNTAYMENKHHFGIKSVSGDSDDFEYVLAHNTMSFDENRQMQRFIFWARVIAENAVFRHVWLPLYHYAGLTQSQVLMNLDGWVGRVDDGAAVPLRGWVAAAIGGTSAFGSAIQYFYTSLEAKQLLRRWWAESVLGLLPAETRSLLSEVFQYDLLTQPIHRPAEVSVQEDLPVVTVGGQTYYVRRGVELSYDVPAILRELRADRTPGLERSPRTIDIYYLTDAESAITSTNHEIVMHFMGMALDEVLANAGRGDRKV
jgi:radical SAM C-methyltransferase